MGLWHASVAIISGRAPRPVRLWSDKDFLRAEETIFSNLSGVGDRSQKHIEWGEVAVHFRRPMTDEEIARIDLSKRKAV